MSTSPATSPRASPSSSAAPGRRSAGAGLRLTLATLLALLAAAAVAQDPEGAALLAEGPRFARGIDALAPDLTPHWYARYRFGTVRIDLHYVVGTLGEPTRWPLAGCAARAVRTAGDGRYWYAHGETWSLLLVLRDPDGPVSDSPPWLCSFVDGFVRRYLFFQSVAHQLPGELTASPAAAPPSPSVPPPPFPAVVETAR